MSKDCYVIHPSDAEKLEIFHKHEVKPMLDRVTEMVGGTLDARSKQMAGKLIDDDMSIFPTGKATLRVIVLSGSPSRNTAYIYLATDSSQNDG